MLRRDCLIFIHMYDILSGSLEEVTMPNVIEKFAKIMTGEAWRPFFRKKKRSPASAREFLSRAIRLYATRAAMPSWGFPFEAIAASALLKDRDKKRRHQKTRRNWLSEVAEGGFGR